MECGMKKNRLVISRYDWFRIHRRFISCSWGLGCRKFFFEFMCLYNINYIKLLVDIECILLGAN